MIGRGPARGSGPGQLPPPPPGPPPPRGRAPGLRGLRGGHQPRSLVPRPHRHPHAGLRGRGAGGVVRGQLRRLRGRSQAAPGRRGRPAAPASLQAASSGLRAEGDMALRDQGAITGVGETAYSRNSGRSVVALQMEAALAAVADAGLRPTDIDGIIAYATSGVVAEDFVTNFGIPDLRFSATTPMGGASCVAALQCAVAVIGAGICRHVLIPLGRNGASESRIGTRVRQLPQFRLVGEFEMPVGAIAPAQLYAPMARRHMELYGTTSRQLAEIAVTTRAHAALNGNAMMTAPITLEDHQQSRMIADPLRLLDCSLESDGAVAVVVSAAEGARDLPKRPVYISGVAEGHP